MTKLFEFFKVWIKEAALLAAIGLAILAVFSWAGREVRPQQLEEVAVFVLIASALIAVAASISDGFGRALAVRFRFSLGLAQARRTTRRDVEDAIVTGSYHVLPGTLITVCVLGLKDGRRVLGYDLGASSPDLQDWDAGRLAAHDMAHKRVAKLLMREKGNRGERTSCSGSVARSLSPTA